MILKVLLVNMGQRPARIWTAPLFEHCTSHLVVGSEIDVETLGKGKVGDCITCDSHFAHNLQDH